MTTSTEALAKERAILRAFKGYPSWSGKVTRGLIDDFLEYVEDVSAEAVTQAVENFREGAMERDNGFPLTGPELAGAARKCQRDIDIRDFWSKTDWLIEGSPEWKALCEAKGIRSLPKIEYKGNDPKLRGTEGWYCDKEQTAVLAPLIAKHSKEAARIARRGALHLPSAKGVRNA